MEQLSCGDMAIKSQTNYIPRVWTNCERQAIPLNLN